MKRIAFISTMSAFSWAGSEELWSQAAVRAAYKGYDVVVNIVSWKDESKKVNVLTTVKNCKVYRRPRFDPFWKKVIKKCTPESTCDLFDTYIYGWLKRLKPNFVVISTGGGTDGKTWMNACSKLHIPYAVIVHLATPALWPSSEELENILELFKKASGIFFVSKHNLDDFSKLLGTALENAFIAFNPVNLKENRCITWPNDQEVFHLACVARIGVEHKGQDILFDIMNKSKWRNRPVSITLYGDGPHKLILQSLKEYWQLDNVLFGGHVDDLVDVWSKHHALVMPSRYEGLPLAVVEAMTCERPCIVTNVGGNAELVEDGISGFIAPSPTTDIFEETLERAWERRYEWEMIGKNAGKRVKDFFPEDPVNYFINQLESIM